MSLTLALNTALSGLNVNKQALSVLSQNIANANTPGYTRKILDLSSAYLDGTGGAGVNIEDVTRKVDSYLERAIQTQNGTVGAATAINEFAERVQNLLGKPGASNSLDTYVNNFFNSMQSLAETPERTSFRLNAISTGNTLATQISTLAQNFEDLRFQADNEITQAIDNANRDVRALASLNEAIANASALNRPMGELLDKRDTLLSSLSQNIDINTYINANGSVNIYTAGGVSLLDGNIYQLTYNGVSAAETLANDGLLGDIGIVRADINGNALGTPQTIVKGGKSGEIVNTLTTGRIKALIDIRDREIPTLTAQLDMMASNLRDQFNAVHNKGSGYPGANSLTGTREVTGGDYSEWSGSVRIALVDKNGMPLASAYSDEQSAMRPLTLDLSTLPDQNGTGKPSVQTIIDEINSYYAAPQNKARVGALNSIRLVSDSENMPPPGGQFQFDFDLENISGTGADFFVGNVSIVDDSGNPLPTPTSTIPSVALSGTNTFTTTAGSNVVTVSTTVPHNFVEGQRVYLPNPGTTVAGIPAADFNNYFTITNVTTTGFDITVATNANANGGTNVASQYVRPKYQEVETGDATRTHANGLFTANLSSNLGSEYYEVTVEVAVDDGNGNLSAATIKYRINNNQNNTLNDRYPPTQVAGDGALTTPGNGIAPLKAMLVDAQGREIAKTNGRYDTSTPGYLKLISSSSDIYIAMDTLDSKQLGLPNANPAVAGTGRDFSFYFELNNFFKSNAPSLSGDTVKNSAYNFAVESRLLTNPGLLTTGQLAQSRAPIDPSKPPLYTYERRVGDNTMIQQLASVGNARVAFDAAGGLSASVQTFGSYVGEMLGFASTAATNASSVQQSAKVVLDGFTERATAIGGVNLDEELANTVIYQNAYAASARIISVTNELFDILVKVGS